MKNLVFLLALFLIGFGVTGWFMDWYTIGQAEGQEGRRRVEIEFDTQKIRKDTSELIERGQAKLQQSLRKPATDQPAKDQAAKGDAAKDQPAKPQPLEPASQLSAGNSVPVKNPQ